MRFVQVDVFSDGAYLGNPLAVFPEAGALSTSQMQAIASEMNLSESSFVMSHSKDFYEVRIFTPTEEVDFAGHPTLGTAWVLRQQKFVDSNELIQRSRAGDTRVRLEGDRVWFVRTGSSGPDEDEKLQDYSIWLARGLGLQDGDVGLEARELGRAGHLRPAFADTGLRHLMVPLRNLEVLGAARPNLAALPDVRPGGFFCFTALQAGRMRARAFMPGLGVAEDPATGSGVADLGVYLADRVGPMEAEIVQGVEMGRLSRLLMRASPGKVSVGGACHHVFNGSLAELPPT